MDPLLILSIIIISGLSGGWVAHRIHLPRLTGNIVAGIIIGPGCLNLFYGQENVAQSLQPLTMFAMGLVSVSVGSHLSYRRIHNALNRIITITVLETFGAFALVTLAIYMTGQHWLTAFILGCVATATAPATIMAVVQECRAKGTFVKTLVATVGLDNIICITLFAFFSTLMGDYYANGENALAIVPALKQVSWQLFGAVLLGLGLGIVTERLVHRPDVHHFSVVFIAILLNVVLSNALDVNFLLTCLFFGVYLGNSSEEAVRQTQALEPIEMLLFVCFFTLAGLSMHLDKLVEAGMLCGLYLILRFAGKAVGATLGGKLSRCSRRIWANTGVALIPQASIAIGLVVLLEGNNEIPTEISALIGTVVLGAVTVNEIIGPFFTRLALRNADEVNKDRRRLIEFLQEENILTGLEANDKWEALRKLTDFFVKTHGVPTRLKDELYATIEQRESEFTTAVGLGAAIPHGRIDQGTGIRGVLGICREGIEFDALDKEPVRLIMLVVTPKGYEKEHLEVMASLAEMISDAQIRNRLHAAISPNDAWEIIEDKDTRNYNYFLDEKNS
jgi:mannitol/fructose-specific phosphotransferase system IIA component (Ntr-type)/predicted Kef-type K+ transport protein